MFRLVGGIRRAICTVYHVDKFMRFPFYDILSSTVTSNEGRQVGQGVFREFKYYHGNRGKSGNVTKVWKESGNFVVCTLQLQLSCFVLD